MNFITPSEELSIDSDEEEIRYRAFTRTGVLRSLNREIIDIEDVPKKKKYEKIVYKGLDRDPQEQIREVFNIKSRLAKRGLSSDLKEIELGIIEAKNPIPLHPSLLPKGGESLLSNPLVKLKSKSSKKKKKKSKKKKSK